MKHHVLQDPRLKNLLRGAQANTDLAVRQTTINNARRLLSQHDATTFAALMCETDLDDFYFGPAFPESLTTIYRTPFRRAIPLNIECALQCSRVRHYLQKIHDASASLGRINTAILSGDLLDACTLCQALIDEFGYSATIARKVIYINLLATTDSADVTNSTYKTLASELLQPFISKVSSPQFSQFINLTIDICDRDIDCLETMREHLRLLKGSLKTSTKFPPHYAMMRRILFPANYHSVVDPISLLFFSSSSAIDLFVDLCTASHCGSPVPHALQNLFADPVVAQARENLQPSYESLFTFVTLPHTQEAEQAAYRASAIFPEIAPFAQWRRAIDFEFYVRQTLPLPYEEPTTGYFSSKLRLIDLCHPSSQPFNSLSHFDNSSSSAFLRTVAVLNCIRNGDRLSHLTSREIRVLLSQTTGFSQLLHKSELLELREQSEKADADVIVFLSMVMLNEREPHEDLAFEMRMAFQAVVMRSHDSNIITFLDWLYERTRNLCTVVVDLCDIAFLERLYLLNETYAEVLSTREHICRWTALKFGRPEYDSAADRLALDSKVRMIREGIDEARIFVDVLRYKQWALDALTPTLRKFERMVSVAPETLDDTPRHIGKQPTSKEAPAASSDYWFYIASERAFSEFCHNKLFGIDSYLSRRIRHGTLAGTLIVPIKKKISDFRESHHNPLSPDDRKIVEILETYRSIVTRIRDDLLHFRTDEKPRGLLIPNASQTTTRGRIQADFRNRLVQLFHDGYSATELSPFFLDHCWDLLTEDLLRIRNELRRISTSEVRPLLRSVSDGNANTARRSLAADLDQTAGGLFSNLLRWFAKSEGSAMTVSVRELVTVVVREVARYFPDYEKKYRFLRGGDESLSGLTYQTVYDLLSLFFSNIAQHADPTAECELWSEVTGRHASKPAMLNIGIVSKNLASTSDHHVRASIEDALSDDDHEESMVREGKSGLGKAMALIRGYSGEDGLSWKVYDGQCRIGFKVPVIVVGAENEN